MSETGPAAEPDDQTAERGSLFDDLGSLAGDGRTFLEAELAFQKSRASYAASLAKAGLGLVALALLLASLAIIGLVIGAILALTPSLGPWGAAGVVFLVLIVLAVLAVRLAVSRFKAIGRTFGDRRP